MSLAKYISLYVKINVDMDDRCFFLYTKLRVQTFQNGGDPDFKTSGINNTYMFLNDLARI